MATRQDGRILIIGAGIAGLATAWALTRRGYAVEIFDQGAIPNPKSSSYDEHRITRHAYGEWEGYAAMMPEAFRLWSMLWRDIGYMHYNPCGATYFMRGDVPWYESTLRSLGKMDVGCREISPARAANRFPMLNLDGVTRVLETDGAGILYPMRILTDLVIYLGSRGVTFHANHLVTDADPETGTVTANGHVFKGDRIVFAGGAWNDRLVPELRQDALPSRQAVMYLSPPPDFAAIWRDAPVMADLGEETSCYMLPPRRGTRLKIGDHVFTRRGDPDEDRVATDRDVARLTGVLGRVIRDFDRYDILERKACFYTVTEDEHFIQRPVGSKGWLISACSGHGFKLAMLTGELAALAVSGEMPPEEVTARAASTYADPTLP